MFCPFFNEEGLFLVVMWCVFSHAEGSVFIPETDIKYSNLPQCRACGEQKTAVYELWEFVILYKWQLECSLGSPCPIVMLSSL